MRVEFTKMHGAGNDFVIFEGSLPNSLLTPPRLRAFADRRTGIGFDQAIVLEPSRRAGSAGFYRIFNADGIEIEQCGNGARCVAVLLDRRGRTHNGVLTLDSPAGAIEARVASEGMVSVDLGIPDFAPRSLPFEAPTEADNYALQVGGERLEIGAVSLGNPHAVLSVTSVANAPVESLGPAIEYHPSFPDRVNVGFLEVVSRDQVRLRVYERGVGETRSCGTGACAAVAVARRRGLVNANVRVQVTGGEFHVDWPGIGAHIWLIGPAKISFHGYFEV